MTPAKLRIHGHEGMIEFPLDECRFDERGLFYILYFDAADGKVPTGAEWLVMEDGQAFPAQKASFFIPTKGGRVLVYFTPPNKLLGQLAEFTPEED